MLEQPGNAKSARWWWIALVALVVMLIGGAWISVDTAKIDAAKSASLPSSTAQRPPGSPSHPASPFSDAAPVVGPDRLANETPASTAQAPAGEPVPTGLTAEQWQQLRESLQNHPERDKELRRVAEYLAYNNALDRFRLEKVQRGDAAQQARLRELAATLDDGLDTRLERSEISGTEARVLKMALLEALESDPTLRQSRLEEWARRHEWSQPDVADPREAEYERQQTAIVAAWYALPAEQRDAAQLQAQLEALRQRIFGNP